MSILALAPILVLLNWAHSFNIDTSFPIIYSDPSTNRYRPTYFGYSVVLYEGDEKNRPWIQVGAPRGNHTLYKEYAEPGIVYRCPYLQKCALFPVDPYGKSTSKGQTRTGDYYNKKDGAWIGGTMDIHSEFKRVVVCGHRWVNQIRRKHILMLGACYWSEINSNDTEALLPLVNKDNYIWETSHYNYGLGESGMVAHFPLKPEKAELLMGAPGVFNWKGAPIRYQDGSEVPSQANKRSVSAESFSELVIPNMAMTTDLYSFGYLGYSISSGYFFSDKQLLYVAGAPRSSAYKGQISIFDFPIQSEDRLRTKLSRQGEQVGEYFGASIAVADINGDKLDDIIVGAPHYTSKMDEGRVYIFFGSNKNTLETPDYTPKITGRSPGGQFGLAVQAIGDLDLDGFADVVVAAPYEDDNRGVVYIYNGGPTGLRQTASQRISARDISPMLRGFGISFSKSVDIDKNLFKDFAVGAYMSGHAVILRGKPIIKLELTVKSKVARLDSKAKQFTIEICVSYQGTTSTPSLSINRTITIDDEHKRLFIINQSQSINVLSNEISLIRSKKRCEDIQLGIKDNIENYLDPIQILVTQALIEKPRPNSIMFIGEEYLRPEDKFCKLCPIVDTSLSVTETKLEVPFALGCKTDKCTADLKLTGSFIGLSSKSNFVIGSKTAPKLLINVTNMGEPAYLTQIAVQLPKNIHLSKIPAACIEEVDNNTLVIVCDVDNPLWSQHSKIVTLLLDMDGIQNNKQNGNRLKFVISTDSRSEESNPIDNRLVLELNLLINASLSLKGNSLKDSYFFGNHTLSNATHIYGVQKFGESPINEAILYISIPVTVETEDGPLNFLNIAEPEGYQAGQPFQCAWPRSYFKDPETEQFQNDLIDQDDLDAATKRTKRNTHDVTADSLPANRTLFLNCSSAGVTCDTLQCVIGPFKKTQNVASLQLKMFLNTTLLEKYLLGKRDIIYLTTENYVKEIAGLRKDRLQLSSIFFIEPPEYKIDSWIIILAIIAGVLILLLIIMGLVKAGFFERKQQAELRALKQAEDKSQPKTPTDLCFLDWQLSHIGPPVLDLLYFIYACTDKQIRSDYDELLRHYHETLKSFTAELGSDIDELYPYEVMMDQFQANGKYGLIIAIMLLHLLTSDSDEIPDINKIFESGDDAEAFAAFTFESKNIDSYNERVRDIILHMVEKNYI